MQLLHEEYGYEEQDLRYTGVYRHGDHKVEIRIHHNSYAFQSSAVVRVMANNASQWNFLTDIHFSNMTLVSVYGNDRGKKFKEAVEKDRKILLQRAAQLLPSMRELRKGGQ